MGVHLLKRHQRLRCSQHCSVHKMGQGAMTTFPFYFYVYLVGRSHDFSGQKGHCACGEIYRNMLCNNKFRLVVIKNAGFEHKSCTTGSFFFARLKYK
jgi:hypothetical protein